MTEDMKRLDHLQNCIPQSVSADKLSLYTIALEGWRRGLPLTFFNVKYLNRVEVNYRFQYNGQSYSFSVSKGPDTSREAMKICNDKHLTKDYLTKLNVPTPTGKFFEKGTELQDILHYANTISYPVVLKPSNSNLGKGVIPNITNKGELEEAVLYVRNKLEFDEVIVETYVPGEEYRVYVVGNQVVGAINRIPAYVTGDGIHTVKELIKLKNEARIKNPNLRGRPIKVDSQTKKYIRLSQYSINDILAEGEMLTLRKNSNISSGGEPVDVTDELSDYVKKVAITAVKAIPNLTHSGVDIIVNDRGDKASVLELNTRSGIGSHLFPLHGKARDVPKAIIDHYFPSQRQIINDKLYFDYNSFMDILSSGLASEVAIPNAPTFLLIRKKIIIKGNVCDKKNYERVKLLALDNKLNGYVKNLKSKTLLIVVAGENDKISAFFKRLKEPNFFGEIVNIDDISITNWDKAIKIGFDVREQVIRPKDRQVKTSLTSNSRIKPVPVPTHRRIIRKIRRMMRK